MGELLFRVYQRTGRGGKKTWTARFSESNGVVVKTISLPLAKTLQQAENQAREPSRRGLATTKADPIESTRPSGPSLLPWKTSAAPTEFQIFRLG